MPNVTCTRCGTEFHLKPYKVKRAKTYFCSFECRKKDRTRTCEHCGKEFQPLSKGASGDRTRYCSQKCRHNHERPPRASIVVVPCSMCGKEIERWPVLLRMFKNSFCSADCKNKFHSKAISAENNPRWLGGVGDYRGADWPEARQSALERDGHTCQHCGMSNAQNKQEFGKELEVHHITRYHDTQDNGLDNLISLCSRCHGKADTKYFSLLYAPQSETQ